MPDDQLSSEIKTAGTPRGPLCLVVSAHPLRDSLCRRLTADVLSELEAVGCNYELLDLYEHRFSPVLTPDERKSYYQPVFDTSGVEDETAQLCRARAIILIFPTWWFGFPAMLKGWFDRVWAPGIAFRHADDLGPIKPLLDDLRLVFCVTTLGCPRWVDRLVLRQPVHRVLKTAIVRTCARNAVFSMMTLYNAEKVPRHRVERFEAAVRRRIRKGLRSTLGIGEAGLTGSAN